MWTRSIWEALTWVLIVLMTCTTVHTATPYFDYPAGTSQTKKDELHGAFNEALTLARFVAVTATTCDESFLRYFQPQDFGLVQDMFRAIANIGFDQHFDTSNVGPILQAMKTDASLSPKFDRLSLAYNDNPNLVGPKYKCGGKVNAWASYYPPIYENWLVVSICQTVFETYYSLQDIEHPPEWALDGTGHPDPGFSCDGLGNHDSDYMTSPGAVLLHELFHWPYIFQDVPGYSTFIGASLPGAPSKVADFPGPNPPNGYDAFYTLAIRDLPVSPVTGASQAIQNADSYIMYANDKYWSWKCGRQFEAAPSQEGAMLRGDLFTDFIWDSDEDIGSQD